MGYGKMRGVLCIITAIAKSKGMNVRGITDGWW